MAPFRKDTGRRFADCEARLAGRVSPHLREKSARRSREGIGGCSSSLNKYARRPWGLSMCAALGEEMVTQEKVVVKSLIRGK